MALKIGTDADTKDALGESLRPERVKPSHLSLIMLFMMLAVVLSGGALLSYTTGMPWLPAALLGHVLFVGMFAAQAMPGSLSMIANGAGMATLIGLLVIVLVLYLLAVRYLPRRVSHRFVMLSTLLLGIAYLILPIVTSQDMFSYIAYARMGVIYHLNPLTTLPTSIPSDPVYALLFWTRQPSAYGPAWAMISCSMQWIALLFGFRHLLSMELLLRLFGLSMFLGSTQLIWSISGHVQGKLGATFYGQRQRRRALLAFAWNPFLLFEACVNAHTDMTILFFVLLALWMLLDKRTARADNEFEQAKLGSTFSPCHSERNEESRRDGAPILRCAQNDMARAARMAVFACSNSSSAVGTINRPPRGRGGSFRFGRPVWERWSVEGAALMLAVAACIKITFVLLLPGLLLFVWTRPVDDAHGRSRIRDILTAMGVFIGVIVLLYAPFWQHGALLQLLHVSPAMTHDVNSPYQFVISVITSFKGTTIPTALAPGSQLEAISHLVSMALFAIAYGGLCVWPLLRPRHVNTVPMLIRWMALAELLYCVVGSPWFWPWYTIPLFGLLALIEADGWWDGVRGRLASEPRGRLALNPGGRPQGYALTRTTSHHLQSTRGPSKGVPLWSPSWSRIPVGTLVQALAISMLSLHTFGKWQAGQSTLPLLSNFQWLFSNGYFPLLYHFHWEYFTGLWIWGLPLVVIGAELWLRHRNSVRVTARLPYASSTSSSK